MLHNKLEGGGRAASHTRPPLHMYMHMCTASIPYSPRQSSPFIAVDGAHAGITQRKLSALKVSVSCLHAPPTAPGNHCLMLSP